MDHHLCTHVVMSKLRTDELCNHIHGGSSLFEGQAMVERRAGTRLALGVKMAETVSVYGSVWAGGHGTRVRWRWRWVPLLSSTAIQHDVELQVRFGLGRWPTVLDTQMETRAHVTRMAGQRRQSQE